MQDNALRHRWAFISLTVAFGAMIFAWWLSLPPRALPADAPPEAFSAERALDHIRVMAVETHPASSKANDRVYEYIIDQVKAMGLEVEVIDEYVRHGSRNVENRRAVLARIRGTAPTKAIAVDAHFDSVPYGPGATDDLGGVGAMLETARALKAGPPLKNDVIFCFADQEEIGGNGAQAFVEHPWFQNVGVMLGLEARGTSGPALMFETSQNNGWVIRAMKKAGVNPRATSIMFDIYDRLPFGSDFGKYKRHVAGWNVAFVDNFCYYHISLDSPEMANPDSIQHMGAYTSGLTRYCGNNPMDDCYAPNATYFNTLGGHLVVYDQKWNLPLAVAVLLVFAIALIYGFIRGSLSLGGMAAGFGIILLAALINAVVCGALGYFLFTQFREMTLYRNNQYCIAFAFMAMAILFLLVGLIRNRIRPQNLVAGALFWQVALLFLLLKYVPGGAYAPTWPLLFNAIYLIVLCWKAGDDVPSPAALGAAVLIVLPALMLNAPALVMFGYTITALGSFMILGLLMVLIAGLLPQIALIGGRWRFGIPAALAGIGIFLFVTGYIGTLPSPISPRLNCLSYGMDFDANQAYWLSADRELDEWTRQFFPEGTEKQQASEFLPGDERPYWKTTAPTAPFAKPRLDVKSDVIENGQRILTLHLDMPRDTLRTWINVRSEAEVREAEILGIGLDGGKNPGYRIEIIPRDGAEIRLVMDPGKEVEIHVRETSYGVPEFPGFTPRPDWMATEPNRTLDHNRRSLRSEHTFSICSFGIGAESV